MPEQTVCVQNYSIVGLVAFAVASEWFPSLSVIGDSSAPAVTPPVVNIDDVEYILYFCNEILCKVVKVVFFYFVDCCISITKRHRLSLIFGGDL